METVGLHVTPILVTDTLETISPIVSTISPSASIILLGTSMHRESCGDAVGFPQINFSAARSILARSSIGVSLRWLPVLHIGLAINEFDVMRALSITIPCSILGTSSTERTLATILLHLHKVQSTIQTTPKLGIIDGDSELLVLEIGRAHV